MLTEYNKFVSILPISENIRLTRATHELSMARKSTELHIFSDASLRAYGCVIYLRETFADNSFKIHFLRAKSRVTPLKEQWNIHRLELVAALLAARLAK